MYIIRYDVTALIRLYLRVYQLMFRLVCMSLLLQITSTLSRDDESFLLKPQDKNITLRIKTIIFYDSTSKEVALSRMLLVLLCRHLNDNKLPSLYEAIISSASINGCHSNLTSHFLVTAGADFDVTNNRDYETTSIGKEIRFIKTFPQSNTSLELRLESHELSGSLTDRLVMLDNKVQNGKFDVILAIGDSTTLHASSIVGDGRNVPALGYLKDTIKGAKYVRGRTFHSINHDPETQGIALAKIIGHHYMKQTAVIVEDIRLADGFLQGLRQPCGTRQLQNVFEIHPLNQSSTTEHIIGSLTDMLLKGRKVVVIHCSTKLMLKIVNSALSAKLYNAGVTWFLSDLAFSRDPHVLRYLPQDLFTIQDVSLNRLPNVITHSIASIMDTSSDVALELASGQLGQDWTGLEMFLKELTIVQGTSGSSEVHIADLREAVNNFPEVFLRYFKERAKAIIDNRLCSKERLNEDKSYNMKAALNTDEIVQDSTILMWNDSNLYDTFHTDRRCADSVHPSQLDQCSISNKNFYLLNYSSSPGFTILHIVNDCYQQRKWTEVGFVDINGEIDLSSIVSPADGISYRKPPTASSTKTYKVVTRPAEPFVFVSPSLDSIHKCVSSIPCLAVTNASQAFLSNVVADFLSNGKLRDRLYTLHCCDGMAIELLKHLSMDLNFGYVVYFENDTDYGTMDDKGQWSGMVGNLLSGAADIAAGAFSMSPERMSAIDFTEPYYHAQFAVITGQDKHLVSIWAFTSPFSAQVWVCIMLSSLVAGIATTFLEWHSPFGLNPRGRKRTKNYGLGSGLLMVVVLLTGHTINIKAPKSWPGKVIQNVWAGLAIFIMTSYTANLAAYLAGQSAVTMLKTIFDSELLNKRVSVIPSSSVHSYLKKVSPKLAEISLVNPVNSTLEAINLIRDGVIDVYLDDRPLLEDGVARYDKQCQVRFSGKGFGSNGYGFGLPKQSWLKMPISNRLLQYRNTGVMKKLAKKYLSRSRPQCEHFLVGTANPYGLEHTGGLFLILLSSIFVSVLLLIIEHLVYHFLVPWMRKQPSSSFWKTESVALISQRLYRVLRSELLCSQKQAAQEMIKIVKQRDFTRLIQKNELQKRRATKQKRTKTKAEMFQEITANIVSYHRQLRSASEPGTSYISEMEQEEFDIKGLEFDATFPSGHGLREFQKTRNASFRNDDFSKNTERYFCSTIYPHDITNTNSIEFDKTDLYQCTLAVTCKMPKSNSDPLCDTQGLHRKLWTYDADFLKKMPEKSAHQPKRSDFYNRVQKIKQISREQRDVTNVLHLSDNTKTSTPLMSPSHDPFEYDHDRRHSVKFLNVSRNDINCHILGRNKFYTNNEFATRDQMVNSSPAVLEVLDDIFKSTINASNVSPSTDVQFNKACTPLSVNSCNSCTDSIQSSGRYCLAHGPPDHQQYAHRSLVVPQLHRSISGGMIPQGKTDKVLQTNSNHGELFNMIGDMTWSLDKHDEELLVRADVCSRTKPFQENFSALDRTEKRLSGSNSCHPSDYFKEKTYTFQKPNLSPTVARHYYQDLNASSLPLLATDSIDECVLKAVSKEDILFLWKQSESCLRIQLHEVITRNRELSTSIDLLGCSKKHSDLRKK